MKWYAHQLEKTPKCLWANECVDNDANRRKQERRCRVWESEFRRNSPRPSQCISGCSLEKRNTETDRTSKKHRTTGSKLMLFSAKSIRKQIIFTTTKYYLSVPVKTRSQDDMWVLFASHRMISWAFDYHNLNTIRKVTWANTLNCRGPFTVKCICFHFQQQNLM